MVTRQVPPRELAEATGVARQVPLKELAEAVRVGSQMPLRELAEAVRVGSQMPLRELAEAVRVGSQVPLRELAETVRVGSQVPLRELAEAVRVSRDLMTIDWQEVRRVLEGRAPGDAEGDVTLDACPPQPSTLSHAQAVLVFDLLTVMALLTYFLDDLELMDVPNAVQSGMVALFALVTLLLRHGRSVSLDRRAR